MAYSTSKAALLQLSRSIACELGPKGIRCNTISPGVVLSQYVYSVTLLIPFLFLFFSYYHRPHNASNAPTLNFCASSMTKDTFEEHPDVLVTLCSQNPLGRIANLDEVRGAALFLGSDASSFCTGSKCVLSCFLSWRLVH